MSICCEPNVNLDDTFECKNMIERSEDFDFANDTAVTRTDKLVTVTSLVLCHVISRRTCFHFAATECY